MPNVLEVKIIGDVTDLQKTLKQAESLQAQYTASISKTSSELKESISVTAGYKKAIEGLNNEYKKGNISAKDFAKQLSNLKRDEKEAAVATADLRKELANLKREQKDLGNGFQKDLVPKVANGGNALMQFSRIAQDVPYGIIGIGNNITATFEAFSHLQRSAGSTGGALKALASSLVGSGGILLAVSLLTTGLTVMAQKGLSVGDVFDMLTGNFDENAKALSELNKEVAKTAGEEIATIKGLVSAAQDASLSTEKRLLAVKKLQDEYPSYFGNLSTERILNGDVSKAVDDVSRALIARARASAIAGKLGENAAKRLELEEKREKAILDIREAQRSIKEDKSTFGNYGALDLKVALKSYKDIVAEITKLDASSRKYSEQEAKATKESILLLETQTEAEKALAAEKKKTADDEKARRKLKLETQPKVEAIPKLVPAKSTDDQNDKILAMFRDQLSEDLTDLKEKGVEINIPIQVIGQVQSFSAYAAALKKAQEDTKIFSEGAGAAINSLAGELSSSLETGNKALDAFVGNVIQGLAQVAAAQLAGLVAKQAVAATSLGTDAAVATGNAVVAATETASSTGPAAAFVLPALVGAAIGFIAAAFSGIKFAHGGIVPGGSFTGDKIPAMLNSGETVMNSQQQANTLMAIANGNSNSLQGNRVSTAMVLETKLRGADILLSVKREERKR